MAGSAQFYGLANPGTVPIYSYQLNSAGYAIYSSNYTCNFFFSLTIDRPKASPM